MVKETITTGMKASIMALASPSLLNSVNTPITASSQLVRPCTEHRRNALASWEILLMLLRPYV